MLFVLALTGLSLTDPSPDVPAAPAWSLHGQLTYQIQGHGGFRASYAGRDSFLNRTEERGSLTSTLFLGRRTWNGGEAYIDPELLAGQGLSTVRGLASPPNGETYRVDTPELKLNLARLFLRQTWNFGETSESLEDMPNQVAGRRSGDRVVLTVGKFSATDIFDANAYAHDPRTQFNSWSLWANAAWDYPADTRGYTYGFALERYFPKAAIRFGSFTEPLESNGLAFDHDVRRAHGEALEVERDHSLGGRRGAVRLVAFANHARMGIYRDALALAPTAPDVIATREPGRLKYGVGLNVEQALTSNAGVFLRAGWNDGRTESWAFTEIERTVTLGFSQDGVAWRRPGDHLGVALAINGVDGDHRDYLASGGYGFMLGDGKLRYGLERLVDGYYSVALGNTGSLSLEAERFTNPAFNEDRGPVTVYGCRLHFQF